MNIAVDFDGTIVDHRYPDIGGEAPGAIRWLKAFKEAGAKVFLWTMRSDYELEAAVKFCELRGLTFDCVNVNPGQKDWTQSPKLYAKIYIDDAAFGCPVRDYPREGSRPIVDWDIVGPGVMKLIQEGK